MWTNYTDIHRELMNAQTEEEKYNALIKAIEFLHEQIQDLKKQDIKAFQGI